MCRKEGTQTESEREGEIGRETKRERDTAWGGVRGEKKGSEQPPNTVINSLPSIICLSPKAATASSASPPCTLGACVRACAHTQGGLGIFICKSERKIDCVDACCVYVCLTFCIYTPISVQYKLYE